MKKYRILPLLLIVCLLLTAAFPAAAAKSTADASADAPQSTANVSSDGVPQSTVQAAEGSYVLGSAAVASALDEKLQANCVLLVDEDSGQYYYTRNIDAKAYPASLTKIMTLLLAVEAVERGDVQLSDTVTAYADCNADMVEGASNADIKVGETVRVIDLLYALMLPSANEAAYMLARHVGGTSEHFVDMMNTRAEELGCTGTHFCNPCGLHEEDHYTTARDLYLIARETMKNDTFTNIIDTVQYRMPKTNMHEERIIFTTNQLIFSSFNPWSYPYNKGIKTGHTSQAGNCFVGYAEYGDAKLYSVVLGSATSSKEYPTVAASFTDTKSLYKWGFTHFKTKTVAKKGDTLAHIKVDLSTQTDQLVLTAKTDLVALLPADVETDSLEATPNLPEAVDAPIKAGDVVGSMTYSYNGTSYGTVELVALSDVEMSRVLYYSDKLSHFFQSTVFKIVLIAAAIFIVLYILFNITFGGIRRRRRHKAMRKRYDNDDYPRRHRR